MRKLLLSALFIFSTGSVDAKSLGEDELKLMKEVSEKTQKIRDFWYKDVTNSGRQFNNDATPDIVLTAFDYVNMLSKRLPRSLNRSFKESSSKRHAEMMKNLIPVYNKLLEVQHELCQFYKKNHKKTYYKIEGKCLNVKGLQTDLKLAPALEKLTKYAERKEKEGNHEFKNKSILKEAIKIDLNKVHLDLDKKN